MIILVLTILGLCLGSFVNALVWRLHEQAKLAEKKSKKNLEKRRDLSILHGRSMCPNCKHQLAAKDLVPVFSWLSLRGKCRYCRQPIGWQYPLVELLVPALFVISYCFWPVAFHGSGLFEFVLWLVFLVGFAALVVYDLRHFLLPDKIVLPLIVLAILQLIVVSVFYHSGGHVWVAAIWGIVILGGIFYVLFQLSKGKWIGGGDVKLGALLGLLVGGPGNAVLLLFFASCLGSLVAAPLLMAGKAQRTSRLPFGPFLLLAAVIVQLFGASIIGWYKHRLLGM